MNSLGERAAARTTVVLWEDSAPSEHALDWAVDRARNVGDLVIASPVRNSSDQVGFEPADQTTVTARIRLEDHLASLRNTLPALRISGKLVEGDLNEELAGLSSTSALIVVAAGDPSGSSRAFARSVGGRLAAIAHGPVAVVPESALIHIDSVLCGIDGSAPSAAAAEFAAAEAVARGLELTLVHAWQEPMAWHDVYALPDEEFVRELEEAHRHVLEDTVAVIRGQNPSLTVHGRLVRGPAQWTLLDAAGPAGLLVVGAHGLHHMKTFLLGSVSHAILLNLRSAVVVVPSGA